MADVPYKKKTRFKETSFSDTMSFLYLKKQYIALGMLFFIVVFLLSNKPTIQCHVHTEKTESLSDTGHLPTIYGVTPTYARLVQKADLTRLSQTLMLVKNFHWIVIEDATHKSTMVGTLLRESGLKYKHLFAKTKKAASRMASGVEQRNAALDWLRTHLRSIPDKRGAVFFMDDDNTYSLKVFDEIRKIKRIGVWPVGVVGGMRLERPICAGGRVVGYNSVWKPTRPFPIDMAGFAINASLFLDHPEAAFTRDVQSGYQESKILSYFAKSKEDLEPLAENCSKVYVWHTRTSKPTILDTKKKPPSPEDLMIEAYMRHHIFKGMIHFRRVQDDSDL